MPLKLKKTDKSPYFYVTGTYRGVKVNFSTGYKSRQRARLALDRKEMEINSGQHYQERAREDRWAAKWGRQIAWNTATTAEEKAKYAPLEKVYFIRGGEAIKIGMSANPERRMATLQISHPEKLELLAVCDGGLSKEQEYHKQFAAHRLHGEWFSPAPEIVEEINKLRTT